MQRTLSARHTQWRDDLDSTSLRSSATLAKTSAGRSSRRKNSCCDMIRNGSSGPR